MDTESEVRNYCAVCGLNAKSICSGCKNIHYCSQAHQKEHWKIHRDSCIAFKITMDLESGGKEHLIASRDLKAGVIVLEEPVAFYSPNWLVPIDINRVYVDEDLDLLCTNCGKLLKLQKFAREKVSELKQESSFKNCLKCTWPMCSEECANNSSHADNECKLFTEHKVTFPPQVLKDVYGKTPPMVKFTFLIGVIRGVGLKHQNPQLYLKLQSLLQDNVLSEELLYNLERKAGNVVFMLKCLIHEKNLESASIHELAELPLKDEEEFEKIYRLIQLNQFIVSKMDRMWWDPIQKSVMYIYSKAGLMTHSCAPNCCWSIGPGPDYKIRIRTTVPVKKGERLTLCRLILPGSHGDVTYNRQLYLKQQGIICKCERCADPTELGTFYSALACPKCKEKNRISSADNSGYLLPLEPLLATASSWQCNNKDCNHKIDAEKQQAILNAILKKVEESTKQMVTDSQKGIVHDNCLYWDELGNGAVKLGETLGLHPNHSLVYSVVHTSVVAPFDIENVTIVSPEIIQRRKQRLLYCLSIAEKISPGLSEEKARLLVLLLKLLSRVLISPKWVHAMTPNEVQCNYNLFKRSCSEALKFYKKEFHGLGEMMNVQAMMISKVANALEELNLPWLK